MIYEYAIIGVSNGDPCHLDYLNYYGTESSAVFVANQHTAYPQYLIIEICADDIETLRERIAGDVQLGQISGRIGYRIARVVYNDG